SIVTRFSQNFKVYLSVADMSKYPEIEVPRIADIYQGAGPIGGLYAALTAVSDDGVFLTAADLPNATAAAALRVCELSHGFDAGVIRLPDGRLEPLFGFYSKKLLGLCGQLIEQGDYRMTEILRADRVRFIDPAELGELWHANLMRNINYPEDYLEISDT
ncbi:MAG: molybdenum cofactor guanylyltransferase, partial [Oscillospiraceae bacterium]|nr:molybdenum cofactor guanylyltransferase [Oscillospiraceae bacterium]